MIDVLNCRRHTTQPELIATPLIAQFHTEHHRASASTQRSWEMSGGLYQTLHFYDTVEQLNVDTSREKVEELMKKIGADPAAIPGGSSGPVMSITSDWTRNGGNFHPSHSATQPLWVTEWLSGCSSHSGRVTEWLLQPLWQSGWVAAPATLGRVAEWLSGSSSHSGRAAEWLSGCGRVISQWNG